MERGGLALAVALAFAFAGCKPDVAALDRTDLQSALAADATLDEALTKADEAERSGLDEDAANILKRLHPDAERAVAAAEGLAPRSPWGKKERDALVALEHDRKDELDRYEKALRSGDLDEKLAALKKQLELERRAKDIAEEVARGP